MSSNTFYGNGLPSISKHQLCEREIIKTEEELQVITSKINEPHIVLRVFDLETTTYCGYHIITQTDALRMLGAVLNANMMLRKEVMELTQERDNAIEKYTTLKKEYNEFYEKEYIKRIDECNTLWGELQDIKHLSVWEFANLYCNEEEHAEAGHMLAKDLLGR